MASSEYWRGLEEEYRAMAVGCGPQGHATWTRLADRCAAFAGQTEAHEATAPDGHPSARRAMDSVGLTVICLRAGRVLVAALVVYLALFQLRQWSKDDGEVVPRVIRVASDRSPDASAPAIRPYSELATATRAQSLPAPVREGQAESPPDLPRAIV